MKYALCVGNNYPGTSNELAGCVNDAYDWAELLAREGYTATVLIEGSAADTMGALKNLVRGMRWGDRLVFTYSGHGTWVNDQDGDEEDHRDEALYMSDGSLIIDDDLQNVSALIPYGAGALILSDSCHSGTVSRFASNAKWGRDLRPRFISPAQFTDMTPQEAHAIESRTSVKQPRRTASLISGCADEEFSYDAWFGGRGNGAFTRVAIDAYVPGMSLGAWYKAIRMTLPNDVHPQSPQATYASLYRRYAKAL